MIEKDSGISLIEVLIYLVITSILSLAISRLISDAANGLERASSESVAARQAIRLSSMLKSDISGSMDLIVLPTNALPTDPVCTPTLLANESFKPYFTVKFRKINNAILSQENPFDPEPITKFATYGLKSNNMLIKNKYFLIRVECSVTLTNSTSENLVNLGNTVQTALSGSAIISCLPACQTSLTTINAREYRFKLPYLGSFSTLRGVSNSSINELVKVMTRKIDETA